MTLAVQGTEVKGRLHNSEDTGVDVKGTYSDGELMLMFPYQSDEAGLKAEVKIKGKLDGDKIKGTWQFDTHSGDFKAKRAD